MKDLSVRRLTFAAVLGALYAALTLALAPIGFGPLQLRVAEAFCVLPYFFPFSSWGLFVGCAISNLVFGYGPLDVIFGSLATLISCFCVSRIRPRPLAPLPVAILNPLIVGAVIAFVEAPSAVFFEAWLANGLQLFAGEFAALYFIGLPMLYLLPKNTFFVRLSQSLK